MRILAIDTTTMFGSVALCEERRLVAEEQLGVEVTHSERLITTLEHLLALSKWPKESLDGIAVAVGPGSFTGLRIGLATAKGLALGLNKPLVGVSSLLILAHNCVISPANVVAIIDARRSEVYAAAYKFEKGRPKCILKEMVSDPNLLCKRLLSIKGQLLLVGDGVAVYEKAFRRLLGDRATIPPSGFNFPHAAHLANIAYERLKRGSSDDIVSLVPNYLRHSDAEIGFRGKAKLHRRDAEKAEKTI